MKRSAPALGLLIVALSLAGCARQSAGGNDSALYEANVTALTPGAQAVRIGEGGSTYPACSGTGTVVNLSPDGEAHLSLRMAPFAEADEVARLDEGAKLFLCTRSLDQRWQGVVVPPADAPGTDCGVTAATATPRDYTGPCRAGWVLTSFVRPSAG